MSDRREALKSARKAAGMTQQQLAVAIDMSRKSIVEMEAGRAPVELRTLYAVYWICDRWRGEDGSAPYMVRPIERGLVHLGTFDLPNK